MWEGVKDQWSQRVSKKASAFSLSPRVLPRLGERVLVPAEELIVRFHLMTL